MNTLSGWDWAILAVAAYVAIVTLVRLMRQRRGEVLTRLQAQVTQEKRRQRSAAPPPPRHPKARAPSDRVPGVPQNTK